VLTGSIQQLHYEMANNLMQAMEIKLTKTYITGDSTPQRGRPADDTQDEYTD